MAADPVIPAKDIAAAIQVLEQFPAAPTAPPETRLAILIAVQIVLLQDIRFHLQNLEEILRNIEQILRNR